MARVAWLLLSALTLAACSEPPAKERHQAEGALAAARAADAAIYAPQELADAEAALQRYDAAVAQRDYRLALDHAIEARDRAFDAARLAGDRKADTRSQAERLLADLEALASAASARLAGTGRGGARVTGAAADRLRAAEQDASSAMQEARTLIDRQAYHDAIQRLAPIVERLQLDLPRAGPPAIRRGGR
jgi:hypothetical protein